MSDISVLKKRDSENAVEYHKRIVYGKLVDKTLADVDYPELAKCVYGRSYAPDVARRMMYGSRKTLELIDSVCSNSIEDFDLLNETQRKIDELKKERQKFSDQRREYNKQINSDGRREHLYDALIEAANEIDCTIGKFDFSKSVDASRLSDEDEAVLVLSDWHYGMTTDNVFNKFDTDICKRRISYVVSCAEERIKLHRCSKLHVVILGDMVSGAIHTSTRVASEELVCDQIMQVSEILAQTICHLSTFVNTTNVYVTYGNHARTVQNKKDNIHRDNMEALIPWWLEQRLKDERSISVVRCDDNEFVFPEVAGWEFCATHGDLDAVKSSPRLLSTLFHKQHGRDIDYIILGDKHHRESFEELGVTSYLCGALCGADDYANDKRLYATPSQLLLIVNKYIGVDAEYRIRCE